jgi:hypothetical protein
MATSPSDEAPPPPYQYTTVGDDHASNSSRRSSVSATGDISEDVRPGAIAGAEPSKAASKETIELRPMLDGEPSTFKRTGDPEQRRRAFGFFARWRRAICVTIAVVVFLALVAAVPIILLKR